MGDDGTIVGERGGRLGVGLEVGKALDMVGVAERNE